MQADPPVRRGRGRVVAGVAPATRQLRSRNALPPDGGTTITQPADLGPVRDSAQTLLGIVRTPARRWWLYAESVMTNDLLRETTRVILRGVIAGGVATATMTAAYTLERRVRRATPGLGAMDYDDGVIPGEIVLHILHLPDLGASDETRAGLLLRWGYGSAFGIAHVLLRKRMTEPMATVAFGSALMGMTLTMFPLLGHTPPPWKWSAALMATSIGTHIAYVVAGAITDDRLSKIVDQLQSR